MAQWLPSATDLKPKMSLIRLFGIKEYHDMLNGQAFEALLLLPRLKKTANLGLLAALLSVDGYGTDIWASVVGILVSVF